MRTGSRLVPSTRRMRRVLNAAAAVGVSAALPGLLGFAYGTILTGR